MADDDIMETRREGCLVLTLNRPARLNAWTEAMRARLVERLTAAASDRGVRSVVLTGAGDRAFCAGQDLDELGTFDTGRAEEWIDGFARLYRALGSLRVPVVAALNGVAAGSAFQFVLLTDIRIGHSGVRMGQPEINSGIASITGPWIMREMLGLSRTVELTLSGRLMKADEALDRLGRPALGTRFEEATEQHQRDDHRCRLIIDVDRAGGEQAGREGRDQRIGVGGERADRHQRVHVGCGPQQRGDALAVEAQAGDGEHKRRQRELDIPARLHPDGFSNRHVHARDEVRAHLHQEYR